MDNIVLLLAGLFSVFAFGMTVALLGSIKLKLAPRIGADDAQFGKMVSILQFTMVIFAILAGIFLDTFGFKMTIAAGMIVTAVAVLIIGNSASYGLAAIGCIILGIGGQFVNVGGNGLVPSLFSDPAAGSNIGNTFFGLGAFLLPLICANMLDKKGISGTLTIIAAIIAVPVIFALLGNFPPREASFSAEVATGLLSNYITWLAALTLFCYIGLEVSMASWISSYASELGASDKEATNTLSLFFICMMISRLVFGLQDKVTGVNLTPIGGYVLGIAGLVSAVAIFMMKNSTSVGAGKTAVAIAGICFAPVFPTVVGVTFQHFPNTQWGTLFGVIFAIGLLGATIMPAWIGSMAKGKTVREGLGILIVAAVGLAVIAFFLGTQKPAVAVDLSSPAAIEQQATTPDSAGGGAGGTVDADTGAEDTAAPAGDTAAPAPDAAAPAGDVAPVTP